MADLASPLLGFVLTLWLHASVLLGAVWLLERLGGLKHPGWGEIAWRGALFGALFSASVANWSEGVWRASAVSADSARAAVLAETTRAMPAPRAVEAASRRDPVSGLAAPMLNIPPREPLASNASATTLTLPRPLVEGLAQLWLASSLAWFALTLWRGLRLALLRRRMRNAPRAVAAQRRHAEAVASALALSTPDLRTVEGLPSPVALPGGMVLLPSWCRDLCADETRALLAHEFAHVKRRDPAWRIAQHLALVPLSLHPLAWLAQHRLEALAERQADAIAARLLGDGRALAECLARCLAHHAHASATAPRLALAMAERPGAVVDRVQHLLEEDPMDYQPPSPNKTRLAIALGLVAALALPGLAVTALAEIHGGHSISVRSGDDGVESVDIRIRQDDYELTVEMEGKIEFAPDESDVQSMAPDAELSIEETRDGVERSIAFSPDATGVRRDYRVNGQAQAFDVEGRAWLALALPEIFRNTGIDADRRAKRILARAGVPGLLAEIDLIQADYGRGRYLGLLFANASLDTTQLQRALELTRSIDSDYEMRQALSTALRSQTLAPAQQAQVLDVAQALGSDYERAELLVQSAAKFALDDATSTAWSGALDGIASDYEQRRVLEALLAREAEAPAAAKLAFAAAAGIGSDYERRQVLQAGLARVRGDAELLPHYFELANGIGSDYERKEALVGLLQAGSVDAGLAMATLDSIDGMGSDHERKEVLLALAQVMPTEAAVLERYRASARELGTFERGQVEQALDNRTVFK